jgi:hypothetical protein
MTKIQFNGRQYTVTIAPDHMKRMGWKSGTDVYIAKDQAKDVLYIEKMPDEVLRRRSS